MPGICYDVIASCGKNLDCLQFRHVQFEFQNAGLVLSSWPDWCEFIVSADM